MSHTQSEAVRCPRGEIIGAVDRDAATLLLALGLVFTKPVESTALLVNTKPSRMSVEDVAISVEPSSAGNDPLGTCAGGKDQCGQEIHSHVDKGRPGTK